MTDRIDLGRCPVPACGAPLRKGHLLCKACWAAVPVSTQRAVNQSWAAWRVGLRNAPRFTSGTIITELRATYDAVRQAAIAAATRARP